MAMVRGPLAPIGGPDTFTDTLTGQFAFWPPVAPARFRGP